ncbi:methyl-accepting chemotaxis protein [Pseudogulbenkiania subflava]|uniref:Methyl-accepting chemotaxis sensory transducer with Cache sensor n=1 Tax=Pseudogulbenkiania subflava DSM 22618 TaxID=1123014 RepID=A0A1Y6BXL9_9NEIS|nr:methyl-accepting chemotaxis protein [Pseudogulbenkiania subflava]SMF26464.1 methyl-accepting chemotaxis sensory transducer with Cache sensor [Pseudogulbenkiania subflava DSM 22618]
MKLSSRLVLIVLTSVLGLTAMASIALFNLHSAMLDGRRAEIGAVIKLAAKQIALYQEQERGGKLTRDQAQAHAIEAISGLRDGDLYVFIKKGNFTVYYPDKRRMGKVTNERLPDGRTLGQAYEEALSRGDFGFADIATKRIGSDAVVPKINGVVRIPDWGWTIGTGLFVDDIESAYWHLAWQFLLIGLIVLAAMLATVVGMSRAIYRRLGGDPEHATRVALAIADGDLSVSLDQRAAGDSLLGAMARMQNRLRQVIEDIQRGAQTLTQAANGMSSQMGRISLSSEQSSQATGALAAAIEQMAVSIDQIVGRARETETHSSQARLLASLGEELVGLTSQEIAQVAGRVVQAEQQIGGLAARSQEIEDIAAVIKDIADQTNLLALNAAIEAARAGEQGRGFAVVADEVRQLAERTTAATAQIASMVRAIQTDTDAVVDSMGTVNRQISSGVKKAAEAAHILQEISQGVVIALGKVREVSAATAEQSQASNNMANNVERIAMMVEESSATVSAANGNIRSLEQLASQLQVAAAHFHL